MPAPWVAGAEARIIGEIHGQQTVNVFHFATNDQIQDEGQLDTLLLQLATNMLQCVVEVLLPAVTQDWRVVRCDAKRIYPTPSDPIVATADAGAVGELSPAMVSYASSLVNIRTGGGAGRGRGRKYLPPPGEAEASQSSIDPGTLTLITAYLACVAGKFMGASPTTAWRLGVLSRAQLGGVLGNFDNSFRIATSLNPVADLAVMRSRRKGHGA
jgi:hypothetical protein